MMGICLLFSAIGHPCTPHSLLHITSSFFGETRDNCPRPRFLDSELRESSLQCSVGVRHPFQLDKLLILHLFRPFRVSHLQC